MYQIIEKTDQVMEFALSFLGDPMFADPNHESEKEFRESFDKYLAKPETNRTIGIYDGETLTGVFSFLVIPEEKYVEMLVALSRSEDADRQMMAYLREHFSGYECFFVYNPRNQILHRLIEAQNAKFDTEQMKMDLKPGREYAPSDNVIPYSDSYKAGYMAIHEEEENYWKAEKVLSRPDRFHVFLALDNGEVVGYIDMEHSHDVSEPFGLFVCPAYRRKGYGRQLLETAIVSNQPKGMMLHVDVDNVPAMNLYSSLGFVPDALGCSIVARLNL